MRPDRRILATLGVAVYLAPQAFAQTPRPLRSGAIEPARADDARVVLSTDRPDYFLGENVIVRFCVENLSATPFALDIGGDYRGGARSNRFTVAVNSAGVQMPDPSPGSFHLGGLVSFPEVKAGEPWCTAIPLMRYARIDAPGRYTIRATHDLGWKAVTAPTGEMSIELKMPTTDEALRIVAMTANLPKPVDATDRFAPTQDYSTLRYPVYLAPLVEAARSGDANALWGIGSIPTPEATRALIDLLQHRDTTLALQASRMIAIRLPDPALDGTLPRRGMFTNELEDPRRYLRDAGWRPEFAAEVETVAASWLASTDPSIVIQGAFMVQAVGTSRVVPSVILALNTALERTLTLPFEKGGYPRPRGAMQELLRTVNVLLARGYQPPEFDTAARPPSGFASPGDAVFWLTWLERDAKPTNAVEGLRALLVHPNPYLRELALKRIPSEGPADLFRAAGPALASPLVDLQIAALDLVGRAKLVEYRGAVAELVRSANDQMFLSFTTNALWRIGGGVEVLDIMAERLATADRELFTSLLSQLFSVFADTRGWGGGAQLSLADQRALSVRWKQFLADHRADLEAGRKISLDDPSVSADLVPPGFSISRAGKPDWPIRK